VKGKELLLRTCHPLNERWAQIKPLIVCATDRTMHLLFPGTLMTQQD